jgi:para-nitrobenzyl esterase
MPRPPVVELESGRLEGRWDGGVAVFQGIPYAAPPLGDRRWRPPAPPLPWTGIREAFEPGPVAPQPLPAPGTVLRGDPTAQDEDCLRLNVWTPALDAGRRPVLVWIHGGGFASGTGGSFLYRGHVLARAGAVVVTMNYRLGALGFLAHPALDDGEGSWGNFGLMDQVAALRWVRTHIADLGGDPGNVTVFGESAGAMSTGCLLAVPAACELFRRAILQSGPPYTHDVDRGFEAGHDLLRRLDVTTSPDRRTLLRLPAPALVAAQQTMQAERPRPGELPLPFLPVVDGRFLARSPRSPGLDASEVELVIGTNRDEMAFFGVGDPNVTGIDEAGLLRWVAHSAPGADAGEAVAAYASIRSRRGEPTDPWSMWVAMATDIVFRWPSVAIADAYRSVGARVFAYRFEWRTPFLDGRLGSCHALEIPFVFGCHDQMQVSPLVGGHQPGASDVAAAMQGAWLGFAHSGEPSHQGIGRWPLWDTVSQPTMVFADGGRLIAAPCSEEISVWRLARPSADLTVAAGPGASATPARSAQE